jgi:hypothetical protein
MRRTVMIWVVLALVVALIATPIMAKGDKACTTIQSGELLASTGETLVVGYDEFGYNYQAHMFNGRYCDYDRVIGGDSCDVELMMKWNDAWISNKDCDGDGLLDRHYGFTSYRGSGAWLTNHMRGVEVDEDTGEREHWVYFCKIVAAPLDATLVSGTWYAADGSEIGPVIWSQFAIILEVESGLGAEYVSPSGPGFGQY